MDFVKSFGSGVKATGSYTVKGRGVVFGGTDLTGDRFTQSTDFGDTRSPIGMPVFYDHGLSSIRGQIGTVKAWQPTDDGIDVEIELDKRNAYVTDVMKLVKSGALGLSTGALSHLVVREGGELKRWIVGEISLTPTPAEPRTLTEVKAKGSPVRTAAVVDGYDDTATVHTKGTNVEDINKIVQDAVVAALKSAAGTPVDGGVIAAPAAKTVTTRGFSNEPVEALKHYLRTGDRIAAKAVLEEGTNNNGGYLVPIDLYNNIIARRDEQSILGAFNFTRITTQSKQIVVPAQSTKGAFAIVAESGNANESEPNFANSVTITNYKYSMLIKASSEFLNDQQANFDAFLQNEIGRAYAQAVNNAIIAGTGSSQPRGILTAASGSVTAASATTISFANVISMETSINPAYLTGGKDVGFAMTAKTYGLVRGLTGNYPQFRPLTGTNVNAMNWDIDGIPVFPSVYVPEVATGVKSMLYGNFSYYGFVENGQLEIKRNDQLYMANDQVGFFCYARFGGDVLQPEAFSVLVQP